MKQFKELTEMLSGKSGGLKATLVKLLISIIQASPTMRDMVLLQLTEAGTGRSKALSKRLDELIIHDRNDAAMGILQVELAKQPAPQTIGIFYGANHLADMEKTLVESLNYRPEGKDIWLTAFTFDPAKSKLTEKQVKQMTAKANVVEEIEAEKKEIVEEISQQNQPATTPAK